MSSIEQKSRWYALTVLLVALSFTTKSIAQTTDSENWVSTKTYKTATSSSLPYSSSDVSTNITYYDGLGRPMQLIAHKQSGSGGDLISHIAYDSLGRKEKEYLPHERTSGSMVFDANAETNVVAFYNTAQFGSTQNPYSQTEFEASPLNRVLKQAAPGTDWQMGSNHEVKFKYQTNTASEVHQFTISSTTGSLPQLGYIDTYPANQLHKTNTYDENNTNSGTKGSIVEFKDKLGRVVLKRHYSSTSGRTTDTNPPKELDTYYVYDDFGNLAIVIPPKLSEQILDDGRLAGNVQILLDGLGYQYTYDHRNRLIRKKLPGKQIELISYDPLDRPIAVGPVLSPFGDQALGTIRTKYDAYGRVAYTMWVDGWFGETTRQAIENIPTPEYSESQTATNTVNGVQFSYTNNVRPTSGYHVLTVNYYDDYGWSGAPANIPSTVGDGDSTVYYKHTTNNPKGLPTGSWVRILETENDTDAKVTYTLYDNKARTVRVRTDYPTGGYTQTDTKYNFIGNPLYTLTKHRKDNTHTVETLRDTYTYTDQEAIATHSHKVNNLPERLLSKNEYDEVGQLKSKKTGGIDITGSAYFQKVDYLYNVRGWLTDINNTNNLAPSGQPIDLFAFKINYTKNIDEDVNEQVTNLYNGNIAETSWRTSSDNILRRYGYSYDYLNRLLDAWYQKPSTSNPLTQNYDEHLEYDVNGNILFLQRNGTHELNFPTPIDDLVYDYSDEDNKLLNVQDDEANPDGFDDGNTTGTGVEYTYDGFGNLITDDNKGITAITYNHLHLPVLVTFGTQGQIEYIYSSDGIKLEKKVTQNSTNTTTEYYNGFQYIDDVMQFFPHAEGSIMLTYSATQPTTNPSYNYVFHYMDHLGNIRLRYGKDPSDNQIKILEENHYYPYGLTHTGYAQLSKRFSFTDPNTIALTPVDPYLGDTFKYKLNGIELSESLGLNVYEMTLRQYDPAIGRWNSIDPVTHLEYSTYSAFDNNPVFWADPSGADSFSVAGGMMFTGVDAQNVFSRIKDNIESKGIQKNNKDKSNPDDIIFLNNDDEEIGRIIIPGHENQYVQTGLDVRLPPALQPTVEVGSGDSDAVGISFDASITVGGGLHGGKGYVYFLRGYNKGEVYGFYYFGGNVGGGVGIGASGFGSTFNRELGSDFGIDSFIGHYNGYTGGIAFIGGSYSWSNIENTDDELWRNHNSPSTWTSSSFGLTAGGKAELRWFAGESFGAEKVEF